ncbi:MAG TPA: hypothetical protein VFV80_11725 [Geminicoccaceae bacterium]|nr:hypothetical protein [Geminicoccaceae bacterium]
MSTPAIVLMTDPSRCNLGDVQYLMQALLEMQKMGEYAAPQAFCDHPAAARDFVDVYADAYPRLVLEDDAIPTPDHLQSLVTNGQIGALEQAPELTPAGLPRPEQNGTGSFPIVVLTLGSPQVLLDALQQAPTMRESVRLIDIVPDSDPTPVPIADAVAVRGLDGESWQHDGSAVQQPELEQIEAASSTDFKAVALHDEQMSLDVVETAAAPHAAPALPEPDAHQPATIAPVMPMPAAPAAPPTPMATLEPALPETAVAAPAEPAPEAQSQTAPTWPTTPLPLEPTMPAAEPEAPAPDGVADIGDDAPDRPQSADQNGGPKGNAGGKDKPGDKGHGAADHDADDGDDGFGAGHHGEQAGKGQAPAHARAAADHDVRYPPVGSLLASADVVYPEHDRGGAHGMLRELAAVLLDDGIIDHGLLDADATADAPAPHHDPGFQVVAQRDAILTVHGDRDAAAVIDDFHGGFDQDGHDALVDSAGTLPQHDADL